MNCLLSEQTLCELVTSDDIPRSKRTKNTLQIPEPTLALNTSLKRTINNLEVHLPLRALVYCSE